ncbi:hypothetical protein CTP10_R16310 [Cupriavidus sp. P-10]|nr:hypothetical protein CTP10_R16310 [Cupriavidus sp. P-10]
MQAFLALRHFELDFRAFLQRLVPGTLDFGVMRKEVFATVIGRDEAIALLAVEPLHNACRHLILNAKSLQVALVAKMLRATEIGCAQ